MNVDQKASLRSILEVLAQEGVKTADVAKQIPGISEKPFRNALKKAGYEFRNAGQKGWFFSGEGEEPLDKNIFDFVKQRSPSKKGHSPTVHTSFTQGNTHFTEGNNEFTQSNTDFTDHSPDIHDPFTQDEIHMIKEMIQSYKEVSSTTTHPTEQSLYDRIKQLPTGKKTRKTIVMDHVIGKRLDEFCETERINKSDIVHLALADFLDKYEK